MRLCQLPLDQIDRFDCNSWDNAVDSAEPVPHDEQRQRKVRLRMVAVRFLFVIEASLAVTLMRC